MPPDEVYVRWWSGALQSREQFVVIIDRHAGMSKVALRIARAARKGGDDVVVHCHARYRRQWDHAFRNRAQAEFPEGNIVHVMDDVAFSLPKFAARLDRWLLSGDRVVVRVAHTAHMPFNAMYRADAIVVVGGLPLHQQACLAKFIKGPRSSMPELVDLAAEQGVALAFRPERTDFMRLTRARP